MQLLTYMLHDSDNEVCQLSSRAVHNSMWGGNVISRIRERGCPAAVHSRGGLGACPPRKFLVILGILRSILVHSESYRVVHRAHWTAHHHNHHCLLMVCMHKSMHAQVNACTTHARIADWSHVIVRGFMKATAQSPLGSQQFS